MQRPSVRDRVRGYVIALLLCGAAVAARAALHDVVRLPFITFFPAVMLTGWWGGVGPVILSVAVSAASAEYFWVRPYNTFFFPDLPSQIELLVFVGVSTVIGVVSAKLHAVQRRFRSVLDATSDGYAILDRQWRFAYVNRAFASLLNAGQSELLGQRVWDLFPQVTSTSWAARARAAMDSAVQGTVVEYYQPLGRWIASAIYPIQEGIAVLARDVSAEKELEVRRREIVAQLETSNRQKDEFLATLSHEMRTPLNAVMGWAAMLEQGVAPPARAAGTILKNANALKALVEDLLDTSSIVQGKLHVEKRPANLTHVVREAVDTVRGTADARGMRLTLVGSNESLWVMGDQGRLLQAVLNLLANAIKFTPPGGSIAVTLERTDGHVTLLVKDTGVGIAPDVLPRIFDRFVQGEATTPRATKGLGLGLAITRFIVEAHDGSIEASSEGPMRGAVFTVRLPLVEASAQPARDAGGALRHDVLIPNH